MERHNLWCSRLTADIVDKLGGVAKGPTDEWMRKVVDSAVSYNRFMVRRFAAPFMFEMLMRLTSDYIRTKSVQTIDVVVIDDPTKLLDDVLAWSFREYSNESTSQVVKEEQQLPSLDNIAATVDDVHMSHCKK
jgi:hypothetical protein